MDRTLGMCGMVLGVGSAAGLLGLAAMGGGDGGIVAGLLIPVAWPAAVAIAGLFVGGAFIVARSQTLLKQLQAREQRSLEKASVLGGVDGRRSKSPRRLTKRQRKEGPNLS